MIDDVWRVTIFFVDEKCEFGGETIVKVLDPCEYVIAKFGRDEVIGDGAE